MTNMRSSAASILLTAVIFTSMLPISGPLYGHAKTPTVQTNAGEKKANDAKIKTGPEVAKRVDELKSSNKQVRNALNAFEKNTWKTGRQPRLNEAVTITGTSRLSETALKACKHCSQLRKVSFRPQEPLPEANIEIIFVPTINLPSEWQGTVIFNMYDVAGNFLDQYIADVVMLGPNWTVVYEVSFEGGQAFLESDPALGMMTDLNFEWGTSAHEQPIDPGPVSSVAGRDFRKASFNHAGTLVEPQGWRGGIGPRYPPNPRMQRFAVCAGGICVGALAGCGAASLFFAGFTFGPCATVGCVGGTVNCGIRAVLGY